MRDHRKFRLIENEGDNKVFERAFSGRITKERFKALDRYCRSNSFYRVSCGHEWDCCGCIYKQKYQFTYKHNQITVTVTQYFNY